MSEIKSCPFPTADIVHEPKVITAVGESWVLCTCGASGPMFSDMDGNGERRAIEAWNTRAERTCEMELQTCVDPEGNVFSFVCSGCGADVYGHVDIPNCPYCKAKVVTSDTEQTMDA